MHLVRNWLSNVHGCPMKGGTLVNVGSVDIAFVPDEVADHLVLTLPRGKEHRRAADQSFEPLRIAELGVEFDVRVLLFLEQ